MFRVFSSAIVGYYVRRSSEPEQLFNKPEGSGVGFRRFEPEVSLVLMLIRSDMDGAALVSHAG